jgi:hypothetical protein
MRRLEGGGTYSPMTNHVWRGGSTKTMVGCLIRDPLRRVVWGGLLKKVCLSMFKYAVYLNPCFSGNSMSQQSVKGMGESGSRILRVGGIAMVLFGFCYFLGVVFSLVIGPAPEGVAYLTNLADHPLISNMNFVVFIIAHLLLIAAVVALYQALKDTCKIAMILASVILGIFIVFDIAVTELTSLSLVSLAQNYVSSTGVARDAFLAEAQNALAILPIATLLSFVISSIGFLIVGLVMLKGVFHKLVAVLGIIVGIEGILAGFYVFVPVLGFFLLPSLFTAALWAVLVGVRLNGLARGSFS